jgi:hypothetical protein
VKKYHATFCILKILSESFFFIFKNKFLVYKRLKNYKWFKIIFSKINYAKYHKSKKCEINKNKIKDEWY